jgi:hypothetical protein
MYTSVTVIALTGSLFASSGYESLAWQRDYAEARKVAQAEKKPLAVFIGSGAGGQEKVSRDGKIGPEVEKTLADSYVCLYVDASTAEGQKLAAAFGNTGGVGLVLSDRSGDVQAFSQQGDIAAADMSRVVKQFADPNVMVRTTVTNAQLSMYPPNGSFGNYAGSAILYGSQGSYFGGVVYGGG